MYEISYEMVHELLHRYLEKIYILNKHKGKSIVRVQQLYELNEELKPLLEQLESDGHNTAVLIREIKTSLEKKYRYGQIKVFIDGAARGNNDLTIPTTSGIGHVVYGDSQLLKEQGAYLGHDVRLPRLKNEPNDFITPIIPATNNVAEYMALVHALEYLLEEGMTANEIIIHSDSSLVVSQVNMTNATRADHLIRLRNCAQELLHEFENITLVHIPREENEHADAVVNKVLDAHEKERE